MMAPNIATATATAEAGIDTEALRRQIDAQEKAENPQRADTFSYDKHKQRITDLEQQFAPEQYATKRRRTIRNIEVNVKDLRREKILAADETLVPDRLIDTNIRREQPAIIRYLVESERIGIFKPLRNKDLPVRPLEDEVTRCVRIPDWVRSFIKTDDGTRTHGWDALEITFDDAMSAYGDLSYRQVGHDNLVFPLEATDIQACQEIEILLDLTTSTLRTFVDKYAWSKAQVDILATNNKAQDDQRERVHKIRKYLFKVQGSRVVYVAYYHPDCNEWLKEPTPLYLGKRELRDTMVEQEIPVAAAPDGTPIMQKVSIPTQQWEDVYETRYPVVLFYYYETEEKTIMSHKGRAYLDEYKQEAATALLSAVVNNTYRSSNTYGSPKNATGSNIGTPKITTASLVNGGIYDTPLDFWALPNNADGSLKAHQYISTQNAQETNQVAWAVNNRADSRKTATEVQSAERSQGEMNTVSTVLFSASIAEFVLQVWEIIRSRALQGKIAFLEGNPARDALLQEEYAVAAAGDVDVVKRDKTLLTMMQDWQVISATPLAPMFLADYLKKRYPDNGERYATIIMQAAQAAQQQNATTGALVGVVKGMAEKFGDQMTPEQRDQLANVIQNSIGAPQQ